LVASVPARLLLSLALLGTVVTEVIRLVNPSCSIFSAPACTTKAEHLG
jgi:hypothetical protein